MTLYEIVENHLKDKGFEGLTDRLGCICFIGDLFRYCIAVEDCTECTPIGETKKEE